MRIDKNKQKNDFDILIATDAISEGFNLHRAGTILIMIFLIIRRELFRDLQNK